jgi:hypothetical protein
MASLLAVSMGPISSRGIVLRLRALARFGFAVTTRWRSRNTFNNSWLNAPPRKLRSSLTKSYSSLNLLYPSSVQPIPATPFASVRCLRDNVYFGACTTTRKQNVSKVASYHGCPRCLHPNSLPLLAQPRSHPHQH